MYSTAVKLLPMMQEMAPFSTIFDNFQCASHTDLPLFSQIRLACMDKGLKNVSKWSWSEDIVSYKYHKENEQKEMFSDIL